ncbi:MULTISPECIES: hypothetical protein [Flammeovirga]|uniref:DUF3784 domain-containing protein n=1 Tax=Flammeovirga agarivorans TaxID=2726742 RepID=A0A7X8XY49_9BACT|nr:MULTISPECIES: hypothetical protein [Flammeovirga]NLR93872.1 hypothetical protein [Flammeovirga agarivorans]
MNYNIYGYFIYLICVIFIIVKVGKVCYDNGNVFAKSYLKGKEELSVQINKMLLIGYYLLNIGYAAITIISWNNINSIEELIITISNKIGVIVLVIGLLHYMNIYIIKNYIHKLF